MPLYSLLNRLIGLWRGLQGLRHFFFWLPGSHVHTEHQPTSHHDHALVISVTAPKNFPRWRQLRYLLRICSPLERRLFVVSAATAVLALTITCVTLVKTRLVTVPSVGGTLTEALIGQPKYLNPLDAANNDVDRDLVRLIYSGLFRFSGLEAIPDLAERYTWSDDQRSLTIHLRKTARFHDGVTLTAQDVRFTFESIQDATRKSPLSPTFRGIKLSTPDAATIVFELDRPDTSFLTRLTVGILPEHLWQDIPAATARLSDLNLKPIGSGPYRVKAFSRDSSGNIRAFTLERFEQYYGIRPFIKTLVLSFFNERKQASDALKTELVDALAFVPTQNHAQNIRLELPQETVAFFNLKNSILAHKEVREALALAIDRRDLVPALTGATELIAGPYPFETVSTTSADLERARQILTKSGWIIPPNGAVRILSLKPVAPPKPIVVRRSKRKTIPPKKMEIKNATSTELALTITVPNEPELMALAEVIKRHWSLLGARVSIETLPIEDLMRRARRERTTQIILLNVLLGPDQDISPFWLSSQAAEHGFNLSNLRDKSVDEALETARRATSTGALNAAHKTVTRALEQHIPALFLVRPIQQYLISTKIRGVDQRSIIASPAERFQNIERWYIKTKKSWK